MRRSTGLGCHIQSHTGSDQQRLHRRGHTAYIGGLTNGETVLVERFIDVNTNGVVNGIDVLNQGFRLTDGQSSVIDGVTNQNVPCDLNPTNGAITAQLSFQELDRTIARYIFRVSSPTGRFVATNAAFRITNTLYAQTITGRVRNSGTNVPYALVAILDGQGGGRFVAGTVVGTNGLFTIRAAPGTYQLVAAKRGFVANFATAPIVNLPTGTTRSNNVGLIATTRSISGRIVDVSNTNVGLPAVQLFVNASNSFFALAFSDANGAFNVPVTGGLWEIEPGDFSLGHLGYISLENRPAADTSTGNVAGITIALPKANALVYGTLQNTSNTPIAEVEIESESRDGLFRARTVTDAGGHYTLGITATDWEVRPSSEDLSARGYLSGNNTQVTPGTNEAVRADLSAQPFSVFLIGRVVDTAGNPVANIRIWAGDFMGSYSYGETDTNGSFRLGVVAGTWYLNLSNSEDDSDPRRFAYPEAMFTVTEGMNVTNITYEVLAATNCITGRVSDYTGADVPDVDVYANGDIDGISYRVSNVTTRPDGTYLLNIANGTWSVGLECFRLESLGYGCPASKSVVVSGGKGTADFVLLPPAGPVTLSGAQLLNGRLRFQIDGTAGYDYIIERSADLFGWVTLLRTNSATLPFQFVDPDPPADPARFYRARPMAP